jgi:hypothetical protein
MQGFYMRSKHEEVLLVLRRRTRDGQVAYQLPSQQMPAVEVALPYLTDSLFN